MAFSRFIVFSLFDFHLARLGSLWCFSLLQVGFEIFQETIIKSAIIGLVAANNQIIKYLLNPIKLKHVENQIKKSSIWFINSQTIHPQQNFNPQIIYQITHDDFNTNQIYYKITHSTENNSLKISKHYLKITKQLKSKLRVTKSEENLFCKRTQSKCKPIGGNIISKCKLIVKRRDAKIDGN